MSTKPLSSRLVLLPSLPSFPTRSKVRFLGCIASYDPPSGLLTLFHPPNSDAYALVDISHLPSPPPLKESDTAVGTWVNVIGYIQEQDPSGTKPQRKGEDSAAAMYRNDTSDQRWEESSMEDQWREMRSKGSYESRSAVEVGRKKQPPLVQALLFWDAGSLDLGVYERTVEARTLIGSKEKA